MWEEIEREATPLITASALAQAMGGKGELPTLTQSRERFHKFLFDPPEAVDWHDAVKRRALGLSMGR